MTGPDWAPLTDGEAVVWQGQPRWQLVLRGVGAGLSLAIVIAVAGYLSVTYGVGPAQWLGAATLLAAAIGFAVPTGWVWLQRQHTRYLLTESALYHRSGVRTVTVTRLPLGKVQNTAYAQSARGSLFDFGTVTIETAGTDGAELALRDVNDPRAVHRTLAETTGKRPGGGADDIHGSLDQWRAVRSEVRRLAAVVRNRDSP